MYCSHLYRPQDSSLITATRHFGAKRHYWEGRKTYHGSHYHNKVHTMASRCHYVDIQNRTIMIIPYAQTFPFVVLVLSRYFYYTFFPSFLAFRPSSVDCFDDSYYPFLGYAVNLSVCNLFRLLFLFLFFLLSSFSHLASSVALISAILALWKE